MNKLSQHEVMNLLIQLSVMLIMGRLFAEVARKIKQPAVVGEILAGIILGPTILGMIQPEWFHGLFPAGSSSLVLDGFVQVAVVMLLFIAGLEVDLHIVLQQGRQAIYTSSLGLIIPFAFGFMFPYFFPAFFDSTDETRHLAYSLFMGTSMAITALPVIARILMDLNIFKSRMGMLVISSAMINDLIGWLIFSVVLGMIGKEQSMSIWNTVLLTVGFTAAMLTVGRGLINRGLPWVNRKLAWPGGLLSLSLALCFLAAAFTEYIGIHAIFGAFIVGIAIGDSAHLKEQTREMVQQFVTNIFAPLFFVSIGLRVNFITSFDFMIVLIFVVLAFAGKVIGCGLGAYWGGMKKDEALAIGFGMNSRGAMEIVLGILALQAGLIQERVFVALVIMALVTSLSSAPFMSYFLKK